MGRHRRYRVATMNASSRHLCFALLIGAGCGDGIHSLKIEAGRLVTVSAEILGDLDAARAASEPPIAAGVPLRATLVWAASPSFSPFCFEHGYNPLFPGRAITSSVARVGCADPFRFVAGRIDASVPVAPGARSLDLSLSHLPPPEALVGPPEARIGYAALVVFADENGDAMLDTGRRCRSPESKRRSDGREDDTSNRNGDAVEPLLAASFHSLLDSQERVTYREGDFDAASYFYPAPACEEPPPVGFGIWRIGDDGCFASGLGQRVRLSPRGSQQLAQMQCESGRSAWYREPRDEAPNERLLAECLGPEELAVADPSCECPGVFVYRLAGCRADLICDEPEWDLRNDPPSWWPCTEDAGK